MAREGSFTRPLFSSEAEVESFALAPGVSFCDCRGRFVFLDLGRGRYFALGAEANRAFAAWTSGSSTSKDEQVLLGLMKQGLLLRSDQQSRPAPCTAPPLITRSALDMTIGAGLADIVCALARLAAAHFAVKHQPLSCVLDRLADRKAAEGLCSPPEDELIEIAAAFARSALIASPLDQCLPRSIAVAHFLLDRNYRSELVIGVRVQPFAAHCWVQAGSLLVNETLEEAKNFSAILVI